MHVDIDIDTETPSVDRTAKVTKTDDQGAIGVPVFFTAEELEEHGIDLVEFNRIGVMVEDGVIVFVPPTTVLQAD
jgi:hypothetical protein